MDVLPLGFAAPILADNAAGCYLVFPKVVRIVALKRMQRCGLLGIAATDQAPLVKVLDSCSRCVASFRTLDLAMLTSTSQLG
jgi:hypothetical protein